MATVRQRTAAKGVARHASTGQTAGSRAPLDLGTALNIQTARRMHAHLLAAPASDLIDLSKVSEVDTAGLQLLLACARRSDGRTPRFIGANATLVRAAASLGISLELSTP